MDAGKLLLSLLALEGLFLLFPLPLLLLLAQMLRPNESPLLALTLTAHACLDLDQELLCAGIAALVDARLDD